MSGSEVEEIEVDDGTIASPANNLSTSTKGQKKKHYSLKRKLEVVEYAKSFSKTEAARKFDVHRKRVQEWSKQEVQLRKEASTGKTKVQKRLPGAGRKLISSELDDIVYEWVKKLREDGEQVSRRLIQLHATDVALDLTDEGKMEEGSFSASKGWLHKFMQRKSL